MQTRFASGQEILPMIVTVSFAITRKSAADTTTETILTTKTMNKTKDPDLSKIEVFFLFLMVLNSLTDSCDTLVRSADDFSSVPVITEL